MMGYLELTCFTVEEMQLMSCISHNHREAAIQSLQTQIQFVADEDLRNACKALIGKVGKLTDEEFAPIEFEKGKEDTE